MTTPTSPPPTARWLVWLALAAWVGVAVLGGSAISSALAGRSTAVRVATIAGAWGGWAMAAVGLAVASTVSLTVVRSIVPLGVAAGVIAWMAGADDGEALLLVVLGIVSTVIVASAEFGGTMVQASAYGDETRLGLRPPLGFLIATVTSWAITAGLVISGTLLLAANIDGSAALRVIGIALSALAIVALWIFPRRWHLLTRRWLVFVPAGVVVHDRLVLSETLMLRRVEVRRMQLALAGTDALDLTGPATGHAVEIATLTPVTVLKAATSRDAPAQTLHASALLVSPSRPGRALAAAERHKLPVGTPAEL